MLTHIVDAALDFAYVKSPVTVVADDTDILILLLYYWNSEMSDIFMRSEARRTKSLKITNIGKVVQKLSSVVIRNLLFIHAWEGCDTTSATFNHGKTAILKLVEKEHEGVMHICTTFDNMHATTEEIGAAGIQLFKIMYGGKLDDGLDHLRRVRLSEISAKSKKGIQPEVLPPTYSAAWQHSLRVFLQIYEWKNLVNSSLDPQEWGWFIDVNDEMCPVMTSQAPAPDDILNVIRCNCHTKSKNQCGSNLCSCRKGGLSCVSACGDCHGVGCYNRCGMAEDTHEDDNIDEVTNDGNLFEKLFL